MTECERIIQAGILPNEFFVEEIRDEFLVTAKQKKVWAVEIDMLLKFDAVCKKHGLKYFLMFGTLLGAVRHGGFVPWDDDVDVGMLRPDYEKLLKLKDEFESPYFLQTPESDLGYFFSYAKIRNSNTSGITSQFRFQNINWGLMLDIFPIDNFDLKDGEKRYLEVSALATDNSNYMRRSNPYLSAADRARAEAYSGRNPMDNYNEIQKIVRQFENVRTDYVATAAITLYAYNRTIFRKEYFEDTVMLKFEGFDFPVPCMYREVLSVLYGDYMQFPPVEQRGLWHDNVVFDPDIAYSDMLKRLDKEF